MTVSYSAIKAISEPEAMEAFLATKVLGPNFPSLTAKGVRPIPGRRFEAPRVLWNVYETVLESPDGVERRQLVWTKALFDDVDCEKYRSRHQRLFDQPSGSPDNPAGFARFFPEVHLFVFFFPADPIFPALPTVFDSLAMRPVVAEHLDRLLPEAATNSVHVERVKYLPEISCILRYDAEANGQSASIYGKVQHSSRGRLTYEVMKSLWDLPARAAGDLVIAEPLGYYPRYDLVLQSALPGEEVKGDRHSPVFLAQCEAAGRAIGHIHGSAIRTGEPHNIRVEIERLHSRLEEFKMSSPKLYLMVRDLLQQITAKAKRMPPESPVPSHGDFKYNQFLHDGEKFGLIDVEYFVQAEPSFDLGKYCGHLVPSMPEHWSDTAQAGEARRIFLDAYGQVRPEYRGRRFALYEALSLATRAMVVMWSQTRNWDYTAQTLISLGYERLKTPWGE